MDEWKLELLDTKNDPHWKKKWFVEAIRDEAAIADWLETYRFSDPRLIVVNLKPEECEDSDLVQIKNRKRRQLRMIAAKEKARKPFEGEDRAIRLAIFHGRCAFCGSNESLEWDHIVPVSKGGAHDAENMVPACQNCNRRKHAHWAWAWYSRQKFFAQEKWEKILKHCPHLRP